MIEIYPEYYERFRCIADRCEDTCCAGWEIDIDDASYENYMRVGGDLGARLRTCIRRYGEEGYEQHGFILTDDMRCPFLDEHNLCDIYRELGEEALCEVCTNTPRNFLEYACRSDAGVQRDGVSRETGEEDASVETVNRIREISISASCPEAARLIYGSPDIMRFVTREIPDEEEFAQNGECEYDEDEPELGAFLKKVREEAIGLLQDRMYTLPERIARFIRHAERVQDAINRWETGEEELRVPVETGVRAETGNDGHSEDGCMPESAGHIPENADSDVYRFFLIRMGTYSGLASIGPGWAERMELLYREFVGEEEDAEPHRDPDNGSVARAAKYSETIQNLTEYMTGQERLYEYEHLLVYYAFLLLNRSIDDYDYLGKAKLVVMSYRMNLDMDAGVFLRKGELTKEDRMENARLYAREVEHAEENLADLAEEILFERAYDTENLMIL